MHPEVKEFVGVVNKRIFVTIPMVKVSKIKSYACTLYYAKFVDSKFDALQRGALRKRYKVSKARGLLVTV